jgi:type VI secretion system protein ImpL
MWRILLIEVLIIGIAVGVWVGGPAVGIQSVPIRILIIAVLILPAIVVLVLRLVRGARGGGWYSYDRNLIWRILLVEILILGLAALVWFGGPAIGIKSVWLRILIIAVLILPPLAVLLYRFFVARKSSRHLEGAIKEQAFAQQAAAKPEKQEEIRVLSDAFNKAVGSLRQSKLGGGSGTALYALPWYMIIGPPAVGKSTALLKSGLKFPFTTGDRGAVKGVGGTRNCDWWFSDQAILLDTAGRYTSEEEDREEWLSFLRLLKRYRKKRPLNGLLVAVSIADVLTASPEDLEDMATKIRSRADQVIGELDIVLPVYLLFTKCDLLSGFVEFFSDLTKSTRSQVLGFTVPLTAPSTGIDDIFKREFDLLVSSLRTRCLTRQANAKTQVRSEIFQFPLQLASARETLATFMSHLFLSNPYVETPRFRGAYFCSGTQEGRPLDRVMNLMSRALGVREAIAPKLAEKEAKKSYFLHNVFTEIIFPDKSLAGSTASGRSRRFRLRLAAMVAGLSVAAMVLGTATITFRNNWLLVTSTMTLAKDTRYIAPDDPRRLAGTFETLDKMAERVDMLLRYRKQGPPWSLRFGFYSGETLLWPARTLFVKRMKKVFVDPAGDELEAYVRDVGNPVVASTRDVVKDYDFLKTYLMVTDRKRLEVDFAVPNVVFVWKRRMIVDVARRGDLLARLATRYLTLLKMGEAGWLERDGEFVRQAQGQLRARDVEYLRLMGDTKKVLGYFILRDALQGRVQNVLRSAYQIPGIYTTRGYFQFIWPRLKMLNKRGSQLEPWVMGDDETTDISANLKNRYFDEYVDNWKKFLRSLTLARGPKKEDSLRLLDALTKAPPLYEMLLIALAYNTDFHLNTDSGVGRVLKQEAMYQSYYLVGGRGGSAMFTARRLWMQGLDKEAEKMIQRANPNKVELEFRPLQDLLDPPVGPDGRPRVSGLKQYLTQLEVVRNEMAGFLRTQVGSDSAKFDAALEEAKRVTQGILAPLPLELRSSVEPLFMDPLLGAGREMGTTVHDGTKKVFKGEVCEAYQEKLVGKYPFAKSNQDALLQDVVDMFSPTGIVWSHYDRKFSNQLLREGDHFTPVDPGRVAPGIVQFYNQAWALTRAFFPRGAQSPGVVFDVKPYQATFAEGLSISEITLEVDGKVNTYRNGPIEQWTYNWPGTGRQSRLAVRGARGVSAGLTFKGDWALLRLIDAGKVTKSGSWYQVEWALRNGTIRVRMDFRPSRTENLLFRRVKLSCR